MKNFIVQYTEKYGWKAALGVFMFFLLKGICWLILGWLGFEGLKNIL